MVKWWPAGFTMYALDGAKLFVPVNIVPRNNILHYKYAPIVPIILYEFGASVQYPFQSYSQCEINSMVVIEIYCVGRGVK